MDNIINFPNPKSPDFLVSLRTTLRPVYERIARERGYNLSRLDEVIEIVCEAASKMHTADFKQSFELPQRPEPKEIEAFAHTVGHAMAQHVGLRSLEALVKAAVDLAYPAQR